MLNSSWTEFLVMLAQVAVALLALLFVSFQIARERWTGKLDRRFIAVQTLLEFLTPSFFAIIAVLPISPFSFGIFRLSLWQMGGILTSIGGLVVSARIIFYGKAHENSIDAFFKKQLKLQPIAVLEYLLILAFSILNNLAFVAIMMVWLLLSGSFETWLFFAELD